MSLDKRKLAVIHIVKKELGLSDSEYRSILKEVAGVESARSLDDESFKKLMRRFVRTRYYRARRTGLTLKQKLFIKHLAFEAGWDSGAMERFLLKYYRCRDLDLLTRKEAVKVIEGLKAICGRLQGFG